MKTLTKKEHIATIPTRWSRQYGKGTHWFNDLQKQDIQKKLDVAPPSKEMYDKIIGNASWTSLTCDSCSKDVEKIVFVKTSASDEYGDSAICKECLEKYLQIINQDARSDTAETGEHLTTAPCQNEYASA